MPLSCDLSGKIEGHDLLVASVDWSSSLGEISRSADWVLGEAFLNGPKMSLFGLDNLEL